MYCWFMDYDFGIFWKKIRLWICISMGTLLYFFIRINICKVCIVSYITVCICLYLCIAIDIDAVGLESEEPEPPPPPQQRSPKSSPNQVISTLTREKRMPFFKKVT